VNTKINWIKLLRNANWRKKSVCTSRNREMLSNVAEDFLKIFGFKNSCRFGVFTSPWSKYQSPDQNHPKMKTKVILKAFFDEKYKIFKRIFFGWLEITYFCKRHFTIIVKFSSVSLLQLSIFVFTSNFFFKNFAQFRKTSRVNRLFLMAASCSSHRMDLVDKLIEKKPKAKNSKYILFKNNSYIQKLQI
jgi:hypothetical protein